jgi:hypothetical protein
MEPPVRETLIGRALAAALLAGALALAWLQSRSPLAQALSEGRPVLGWLRLDGQTPALFLTIYQPVRRTLDLVYLPRARGSSSVEAAGAQLAALAPAAGINAGLPIWSGALPGLSAEPPLDAADWLESRVRSPRSWPRTFYPSSGPAWSWFDRLALALELQRLGPADLRPAWLPPDIQAAGLLNRLILGAADPPPERVTVEVLNASTQPGIASRAKNILRLRGADVMSVGNVGGHERTVVYDRTGRFENAAAVRRMLGCPAARAVTQVDLKRLVDVSVVLAEDCPLPQGG